MKKILVATHGRMASGIQSSIKILTGLQDQLAVIDAYVDNCDLQAEVQSFIEQTHGQPCVILTDIVGGSVAQVVSMQSANQKHVFLVSGVNLPIVLSLLINTEPLTVARIDQLISECQVQRVTSEVKAPSENMKHEDFFAS